jgi:hypothetical protein
MTQYFNKSYLILQKKSMKNIIVFIIILFFKLGIAQETVGLLYNDSEEDKSGGYTLFNVLTDDRVMLINNCGEVVNQWDFSGKISGQSYFLDNGNLLQSNSEYADIRDWDNNIVWSINFHDLGFEIHHDIAPLPNGNFLVLSSETYTSAEMYNEGKDNSFTDADFVLDNIIEVEPIGTNSANIVWEWKFFDHIIQDFDNTKPNYGVISENPQLLDMNYDVVRPYDYTHVNGIDYNEQLDQILISARHTNEIYIIDHSTTMTEAASHSGGFYGKGGDFLWRWGNPDVYDQGDASNQKLGKQHDPKWITKGAYKDEISVFSNDSFGTGTDSSSIHIIDPSDDNGMYFKNSGRFLPDDYDWSWSGSIMNEVLYEGTRSGVFIMPNDNALINESSNGRISEIDNAGNVIWVYKIPIGNGENFDQFTTPNVNGSFRATRYPLDYSGFDGVTFNNTGIIEDVNSISADCINRLSVDDSYIVNLNVYPNPTKDILNFTQHIDEIKVYDISGKIVLNKSNSEFINLEKLSNGLYLVRVSEDEKSKTFRISKN